MVPYIKTNLHIVGLCAARHLANQKNLIPVVYEQSSDIGGTWVYNDKVGKDENGMPIHSSMYKSLKTNLPKEVMAFPDFPFSSDETESFLHHTQGNLLGVLSSGQVQICNTKDLESFAQQVLVTFFLYFNLKQKPLLQTMLAIYGFHLENKFLEKIYIKKCNSEPLCFLRRSVLLKRKHN